MLINIMIQFVGVLMLSIAMKKHAKSMLKIRLSETQEKIWRGAGFIVVLYSFISATLSDVASIAVVNWLCYLALNIAIIAIIHSYFYLHPRR